MSMWTNFANSLLMDRGAAPDKETVDPILRYLYSDIFREVSRYRVAQDKRMSTERLARLKAAQAQYKVMGNIHTTLAETHSKNNRVAADTYARSVTKLRDIDQKAAAAYAGKNDDILLAVKVQNAGAPSETLMNEIFGYALQEGKSETMRVRGSALQNLIDQALMDENMNTVLTRDENGLIVGVSDSTSKTLIANARDADQVAKEYTLARDQQREARDRTIVAIKEQTDKLAGLGEGSEEAQKLRREISEGMAKLQRDVAARISEDPYMVEAELDKIRKEDEFGNRLMEDFEKASAASFGDKGKESWRMRGQAVADPVFREWAQDHGFNIGSADPDGKNYAAKKEDWHALAAYQRELERPPNARLRSRTTNELVRVTLPPAEPRDLEAFRGADGFAYQTINGVKSLVYPRDADRMEAEAKPQLAGFFGRNSDDDGKLVAVTDGSSVWVRSGKEGDGPFKPLSESKAKKLLPMFKEDFGVKPLAKKVDGTAAYLSVEDFGDYLLPEDEDEAELVADLDALVAADDADVKALIEESQPVITRQAEPDPAAPRVVYGFRVRMSAHDAERYGARALRLADGEGGSLVVRTPTEIEILDDRPGKSLRSFFLGGMSASGQARRLEQQQAEEDPRAPRRQVGTRSGVPVYQRTDQATSGTEQGLGMAPERTASRRVQRKRKQEEREAAVVDTELDVVEAEEGGDLAKIAAAREAHYEAEAAAQTPRERKMSARQERARKKLIAARKQFEQTLGETTSTSATAASTREEREAAETKLEEARRSKDEERERLRKLRQTSPSQARALSDLRQERDAIAAARKDVRKARRKEKAYSGADLEAVAKGTAAKRAKKKGDLADARAERKEASTKEARQEARVPEFRKAYRESRRKDIEAQKRLRQAELKKLRAEGRAGVADVRYEKSAMKAPGATLYEGQLSGEPPASSPPRIPSSTRAGRKGLPRAEEFGANKAWRPGGNP